MKTICFLIAFLISSLSNGQNYLDYYKGINEGKCNVINNKIEASVINYFETFEKFDFVFARDCYHAIELAASINDTLNLDYFIKRALKQGIKLAVFDRLEKLKVFRTSEYWKEIELQNDSLRNIYKESINWEVRKEIIQMFEADQAIRKSYYSSRFFKRRKIGQKWELLNQKQINRLIEITNEYGFPGEKLIGIDTKEMHPKIIDQNISAGMPIVLFLHHYSQANKSFDDLLVQQIKSAHLYNEHFATICDFEAAFGNKKYPNYGYYALKQFPKKRSKDDFKQKRTEIGLLSSLEMSKLHKTRKLTLFWKRLY